jgi:hypothetical protein
VGVPSACGMMGRGVSPGDGTASGSLSSLSMMVPSGGVTAAIRRLGSDGRVLDMGWGSDGRFLDVGCGRGSDGASAGGGCFGAHDFCGDRGGTPHSAATSSLSVDSTRRAHRTLPSDAHKIPRDKGLTQWGRRDEVYNVESNVAWRCTGRCFETAFWNLSKHMSLKTEGDVHLVMAGAAFACCHLDALLSPLWGV